jgi:hypothetical protein
MARRSRGQALLAAWCFLAAVLLPHTTRAVPVTVPSVGAVAAPGEFYTGPQVPFDEVRRRR